LHKKTILILLLSGVAITFLFLKINYNPPNFPYTQEYVVGNANIKGEVNTTYFSNKNKEFEIAANKNGEAVFKDPSKAFKKLKNDYTTELKKIQKTFKLFPINQLNFSTYGDYSWQISDVSSATEKENLSFISAFIDIYENSFK
ncbi:MAG: hypothetical protein ACRCYE_05485, partial [Sarcina sp.]